MLQKGIIETIEDKYTVKVRVPKYDKLESSASGTRSEDLATGIVCTLPGMNLTYAVGDIVLVDFENDELSKPVILGLLYRDYDSSSVLEIQGIDSSIEDINNALEEISAKSLYTHIKYSNDNGMTFTSLYDPDNTTETINFTLASTNPIHLDPSINYVYWNIIDDNNVDVTQSIPIETRIHGTNTFKGIDIVEFYETSLIQTPIELKVCEDVELTFSIALSAEEARKYYISLTTDVNSIGSVYGDYIGISTSNDNTPSNNTKDYSWSSVTARNDTAIDKVSSDLLRRIQANEQDIRGYSEDIVGADGEPINSGLGILEAISISLSNVLIGLDRSMVYFGNFDNYIDVYNSNLHVNTVTQGEFEIRRNLGSGTTPHLTVFYTY